MLGLGSPKARSAAQMAELSERVGFTDSTRTHTHAHTHPPAHSRARTHTGQQELKKLRVLCLHGFRQTAGSFFGRTHAFRKALKVKS